MSLICSSPNPKFSDGKPIFPQRELVVTPLVFQPPTIGPDALQQKADALELSGTITLVTSPQQQADAITAGAMLKSLIKGMEATREAEKKPYWNAGKAIDAIAKEYSNPLEVELARVEKLLSDYQRQLDRMENVRKSELELAQREARAAEQYQRAKESEELARLQEENDKARLAELAAIQNAADAAAKEEAQRLADEAAMVRAENARLVQQACREAEEARLEQERERARQLHTIVPVKPEAARVIRKVDYKLMDIHELYAARPDLVELTDRRSAILAAISIPNAPAIPGIYVFESVNVQSKAL